MTRRTTNATDPRQGRLRILAALYGNQPPPGATSAVLAEWACLQVDRGRSERDVAATLGWAVDDVRRVIGERTAE